MPLLDVAYNFQQDDQLVLKDVTHPIQFSKLYLLCCCEMIANKFLSETASAKLRVENVHYDLTEEDLDVRSMPLFKRTHWIYTYHRIFSTELAQYLRPLCHTIAQAVQQVSRMSHTRPFQMLRKLSASLMVQMLRVSQVPTQIKI